MLTSKSLQDYFYKFIQYLCLEKPLKSLYYKYQYHKQLFSLSLVNAVEPETIHFEFNIKTKTDHISAFVY